MDFSPLALWGHMTLIAQAVVVILILLCRSGRSTSASSA